MLRKEQGWGGHGRAPGLSTQPSQLQEQVLGISSRLGISLDGNIWMGDLCSLPSSGLGGFDPTLGPGGNQSRTPSKAVAVKAAGIGALPQNRVGFCPFCPSRGRLALPTPLPAAQCPVQLTGKSGNPSALTSAIHPWVSFGPQTTADLPMWGCEVISNYIFLFWGAFPCPHLTSKGFLCQTSSWLCPSARGPSLATQGLLNTLKKEQNLLARGGRRVERGIPTSRRC